MDLHTPPFRFVQPSEGETIVLGALTTMVIIPSTATHGAVALVEHTLAPGYLGAPPHRHEREDEISYILEGQLTVLPGVVLPTLGAYDADVRHVPMDADGMEIGALSAELARLDAAGRRPKLIYTIPSFQNPAGVSLSLERRRALIEIAAERRILILEDDPYSRLRFEGEPLPSLAELDAGRGGVIHVGTFSKILAPGLRIGFAVAPAAIVAKLNLAKQGVDLCIPIMSPGAISLSASLKKRRYSLQDHGACFGDPTSSWQGCAARTNIL